MVGTHAEDPGSVGVLLDLDGVLWDTSALHQRAFAEVARRHGLEPVDYDRLAGRPTGAAWHLVLEANDRRPQPELVRLLTGEKQELARGWLRSDPPLNPEIGLLGTLPRPLARLALVTGASTETTGIFLAAAEALGVTFEIVITGESVKDGKPSPAPYEMAMASLQLSPDACWVLEDSIQGLVSAHAAQARSVHLTPEGDGCTSAHAPTVACVSSLAAFLSVTSLTVSR